MCQFSAEIISFSKWNEHLYFETPNGLWHKATTFIWAVYPIVFWTWFCFGSSPIISALEPDCSGDFFCRATRETFVNSRHSQWGIDPVIQYCKQKVSSIYSYFFIAYVDQIPKALLPLRNGSLDFINLCINRMVNSLSGNHHSESIEISEILLRLSTSDLLGPGCLLPGFDRISFVQGLSHNSGRCTTANVNLEISQR